MYKKILFIFLMTVVFALTGCSGDVLSQIPTIQSSSASSSVSPTPESFQTEESNKSDSIKINSDSEESIPKDVDNDWLNIPVTAEKNFLYEETSKGTVIMTNYIGADSEINIPPTLGGKNVVAIGNESFKGCENLKTVIISNGVEMINRNAFLNCNNIEFISIPDSVKEINEFEHGYIGNSTCDNAFEGCEKIRAAYKGKMYDYEHIDWLYDAININNRSESGMIFYRGDILLDVSRELSEVTIPDNVKGIWYTAFMGCKNLTNVTIPDSVEYIMGGVDFVTGTFIGGAFFDCEKLTSIDLPDSITKIGAYAFFGCKSLISINIPEGVTEIEGFTFGGCESLRSIILPDSIAYLDKYAFAVSEYDNPDHILNDHPYKVNENIQIIYKGRTFKYNEIKILRNLINGE